MFSLSKGSIYRKQKEKEKKMKREITEDWEPTGTGTGFYSVPFRWGNITVCYMTNKITKETSFACLNTCSLIPWDKAKELGID